MSTKDLIERLRDAKTTLGYSLCFGLVTEAADALERLSAEVSRLTAELAEANIRLNKDLKGRERDLAIKLQQQVNKTKRVEGELAELRAQEPVAELDIWDSFDELPSGIKLYAMPIPAAQAVPEGWQLVPKEPTTAMLDEAINAGWSRIDIYAAMLAAAPQPPASDDAMLFAAEAKLAAERKS